MENFSLEEHVNDDMFCSFIMNLENEYKLKLKSYEGEPFYTQKYFSSWDRFDSIVFALELNKSLQQKINEQDFPLTEKILGLEVYINDWIAEHKKNYSRREEVTIYKVMLHACGVYSVVNPQLDFNIFEAQQEIANDVHRIKELPNSTMLSCEKSFTLLNVWMLSTKDSNLSLINLTLHQKDFEIGNNAKGLMFICLLLHLYNQLNEEIETGIEDFVKLLYEFMVKFGLIKSLIPIEGLGIAFLMKNIQKRMESFSIKDMDAVSLLLRKLWMSLYIKE